MSPSLTNYLAAASAAQRIKDVALLAHYAGRWSESAMAWHQIADTWRLLARPADAENCVRESRMSHLTSQVFLARIGELAPSAEAA